MCTPSLTMFLMLCPGRYAVDYKRRFLQPGLTAGSRAANGSALEADVMQTSLVRGEACAATGERGMPK